MLTDAPRGNSRGARERILAAATRLFYAQGVHATGVEQLAAVARVSKRTLYQHFASKDDIVAAYLDGLEPRGAAAVGRSDLGPADALVALFEPAGERGCPFLNVAVEVADPEHPAHRRAAAHTRAFTAALTDLAARAGARDPEELGAQLAVLFDGAAAQSVSLDSQEAFDHARRAAEALIARATG